MKKKSTPKASKISPLQKKINAFIKKEQIRKTKENKKRIAAKEKEANVIKKAYTDTKKLKVVKCNCQKPKLKTTKKIPQEFSLRLVEKNGDKFFRIDQLGGHYFTMPYYEGIKMSTKGGMLFVDDVIAGSRKIYRKPDLRKLDKKGMFTIEIGGREYSKGGLFDWESLQKELKKVRYVEDKTTLYVVELQNLN